MTASRPIERTTRVEPQPLRGPQLPVAQRALGLAVPVAKDALLHSESTPCTQRREPENPSHTLELRQTHWRLSLHQPLCSQAHVRVSSMGVAQMRYRQRQGRSAWNWGRREQKPLLRLLTAPATQCPLERREGEREKREERSVWGTGESVGRRRRSERDARAAATGTPAFGFSW